VCAGVVDLSKSQSLEVIWDRPLSRRTGGVRSITLEVCRQGGGQRTIDLVLVEKSQILEENQGR
jgi:hypothetical protein